MSTIGDTTSHVLGVALGMFFIYYILGLIVSYITSKILEWLKIRANTLENGLKDLLSGNFDTFMKNPLIETCLPKKLGFFNWKEKAKKVEEIPLETFSAAVLKVIVPEITGSENEALKNIREGIGKLPDKNLKDSLLAIMDSGVKDVRGFRKGMETWFDNKMTQIGELYKQYARRITIFISLLIVLVIGVDSVQIAKHLWREPAQLNYIVQQIDQLPPEGSTEVNQADNNPVLKYQELVDATNIPLTWLDVDFQSMNSVGAWALKLLGLALSWLAVAQGSSFWYQNLKKLRDFTTGKSLDTVTPAPEGE